MADQHQQMQPPDYHRCLEQVLSSPEACQTLLEQLSEMTEAQARSEWSPWRGQQPPPYGTDVAERVPAEVRLVALQATYDSYRESHIRLWQRLYDVMGTPPIEKSNVELIESVRMTIDRLQRRIVALETEPPPG